MLFGRGLVSLLVSWPAGPRCHHQEQETIVGIFGRDGEFNSRGWATAPTGVDGSLVYLIALGRADVMVDAGCGYVNTNNADTLVAVNHHRF